ncbi:hypothetical protein RV04_GL001537 [Enterococcus hermanniensis]|uniref:Uncharacterized protein n=1 Tax=Enterococcus hermanniensis TaxID=249189 RepID=A0A1L8T999_9ENTE|nr:hypothetical protein RV04_GL001537 [Enterococcus hermanniensis]
MHRCLGEPLPHQLANAPRIHPQVTQKRLSKENHAVFFVMRY